MKIEIITCRPKNHPFPIASWLIRLFEGRIHYSHFCIKIGTLVLDATGHGVRFSGNDEFFMRYHKVSSYNILVDRDFSEIINWCSTYLNRHYGYSQIFGLALKILGLVKRNPFGDDSNNLICNELVLLFLEEFCNLKIGDSDDYGLVETEILVKTLSS